MEDPGILKVFALLGLTGPSRPDIAFTERLQASESLVRLTISRNGGQVEEFFWMLSPTVLGLQYQPRALVIFSVEEDKELAWSGDEADALPLETATKIVSALAQTEHLCVIDSASLDRANDYIEDEGGDRGQGATLIRP